MLQSCSRYNLWACVRDTTITMCVQLIKAIVSTIPCFVVRSLAQLKPNLSCQIIHQYGNIKTYDSHPTTSFPGSSHTRPLGKSRRGPWERLTLTLLSRDSKSRTLFVLLFSKFLITFSCSSGVRTSPRMWLSGKYPLCPNSFSQMISSPSSRVLVSTTGKAPPHMSRVTFSSAHRGKRLSG